MKPDAGARSSAHEPRCSSTEGAGRTRRLLHPRVANGKSSAVAHGVYRAPVPRRRIEEPDDVERAIGRVFETERRDLAEGVRRRRQARGWTQQQLAEESRLSVIYVSHLELARANVNPTLRALAALAHALGCRVGELAAPVMHVAESLPYAEAYGSSSRARRASVAQVAESLPASEGYRRSLGPRNRSVATAATTPRKSPPKKRG